MRLLLPLAISLLSSSSNLISAAPLARRALDSCLSSKGLTPITSSSSNYSTDTRTFRFLVDEDHWQKWRKFGLGGRRKVREARLTPLGNGRGVGSAHGARSPLKEEAEE